MISAPDRRKRVELINQARESGARLAPACKTAGITARPYERWTKDGDIREDHRPMATRPVPANKLTPEEEQQILDTCHRPEYASLPPSQIVPRLADQGIYIASESSFYRALHKADEQHHRGRSKKPDLSARQRNVVPPALIRCGAGISHGFEPRSRGCISTCT